jgi:hypothetical protein
MTNSVPAPLRESAIRRPKPVRVGRRKLAPISTGIAVVV